MKTLENVHFVAETAACGACGSLLSIRPSQWVIRCPICCLSLGVRRELSIPVTIPMGSIEFETPSVARQMLLLDEQIQFATVDQQWKKEETSLRIKGTPPDCLWHLVEPLAWILVGIVAMAIGGSKYLYLAFLRLAFGATALGLTLYQSRLYSKAKQRYQDRRRRLLTDRSRAE